MYRTAALLALALLLTVPRLAAQEADASRALRAWLARADGLRQSALVAQFYAARTHAPAWRPAGPDTAPAPDPAEALLPALRAALPDVPPPHADRLARLLAARAAGPLRPDEAAELDVRLTDAFLHAGTILLRGQVRPRAVHPGWQLPPREADLPAVLADALRRNAIAGALAALAPPYPAYTRLRDAYVQQQALAAAGGWPAVPPGPALELRDVGPGVRALRERLRASGDLPDSAPPSAPDSLDRFDDALDAAVRTFQQRHGLAVDGIVGRATRAALAVPAEARLRQLALTLERWRWMPADLGRRHLVVNLPGCALTVTEADTLVLAMRAIVGTPGHRTPLFSALLTEVVLAPYWNVPASIARDEILPALRRDPRYLVRHHMTRLPGGRIRQAPGPTNPLGRIKFTITNPYGIGLHDTPSRELFSRTACTFSHGCLRIEQPLALATYVLRRDPAWTPERMEATIERWVETRIPVPEPLPVHVLYWTAWVDENGLLYLYPDLFGYDARLAQALR